MRIINTSKDNKANTNSIKKSNSYKDFFLFSCHLSDFFVKQMQLIFIIYVIVFDTDIATFTSKISDSGIPYIARVLVDLALAFIFVVSINEFIKIQKKLTIWLKSKKYGTQIKIPTAFSHYYKTAILEVITMICLLLLTAVFNYIDGMNLFECILSWYIVITYAYYLIIHMIHGFIVKHDRKTLRQREIEQIKKYW